MSHFLDFQFGFCRFFVVSRPGLGLVCLSFVEGRAFLALLAPGLKAARKQSWQ